MYFTGFFLIPYLLRAGIGSAASAAAFVFVSVVAALLLFILLRRSWPAVANH